MSDESDVEFVPRGMLMGMESKSLMIVPRRALRNEITIEGSKSCDLLNYKEVSFIYGYS